MQVGGWRAIVLVLACGVVTTAQAQPAWIVRTTGEAASTPASTVVLFRDRTLTVATLALDYEGPDAPIAVLWPLPAATDTAHVRFVPRDVIDRVDTVSMPRLVERWERDPCDARTQQGETGLTRAADRRRPTPDPVGSLAESLFGAEGLGDGTYVPGGATIRAPLERSRGMTLGRGDYDITVLDETSADALEAWLIAHGYRVPEDLHASIGALGVTTFVVARLEHPSPQLPPLRAAVHGPVLSLPLVAAGAHDLVVQVLASQRFDVDENGLLPPTCVAVREGARFGSLYAAVLDRIFTLHPSAVVTEHAWSAASCEGCPGGRAVRPGDLATLGASIAYPEGVVTQPARMAGHQTHVPLVRIGQIDVDGPMTVEIARRIVLRHVNEARFCFERGLAERPDLRGQIVLAATVMPNGSTQGTRIVRSAVQDDTMERCMTAGAARWTFPSSDALTQLQITYAFDPNDGPSTDPTVLGGWMITRLHARVGASASAWTLTGTSEAIVGGREREEDEHPDATRSRFQTRYVLRHPWDGALSCDAPARGVWGAPTDGTEAPAPIAAGRERTPLDASALEADLAVTLGSIGLALPPPIAPPPIVPSPIAPEPAAVAPPATAPPPAAPTSSCACRTQVHTSSSVAPWLAVVIAFARRRRTLLAR